MTVRTLLLCAVLTMLASCTFDDGPGRIAADLPSRADFAEPGKVLVARCGSLDCHGESHRNYRLYGFGGGRLDPSDRPDSPGTTDGEAAELSQNYDATVAIEPERMRAVAERREDVSQLTLVRKARGKERHKGGTRIAEGSASDLCLVGWLTGAPDEAACKTALDEIDAAKRP